VDWLVSESFIFVLAGREIEGFLTPSDLDKPPARVFFYVLLADVEMKIAAAIRRRFSDTSEPIGLLEPARTNLILGRARGQRRANVDLDPLSYADFGDLIAIVSTSADLLQTGLGSARWRDRMSRLVELRHRVMHAVKPLVSADFSVEMLRDALAELDQLSARLSVA
jgi:hypothetical protein